MGTEGRGGYQRWGGMGRQEVKIKGSNGREGPAGLDVQQWEDSRGFQAGDESLGCVWSAGAGAVS